MHLRSSRYERERTERFEQLNVLHTVSSVLASSLEPEVLVRGTLSALVSHTRASAGVVYLKDEDSDGVSVVAAEGFDAGQATTAALLDLHQECPLMNGVRWYGNAPESLEKAAETHSISQGMLVCRSSSKRKSARFPLGIGGIRFIASEPKCWRDCNHSRGWSMPTLCRTKNARAAIVVYNLGNNQ